MLLLAGINWVYSAVLLLLATFLLAAEPADLSTEQGQIEKAAFSTGTHNDSAIINRDCSASSDSMLVDSRSMVPMMLYTDHSQEGIGNYYTIVKPPANDTNYSYEKTLGKVLRVWNTRGCGCATARVAQYIANQSRDSNPEHADHKLFGVGIEEKLVGRRIPSLNTSYEPTNEEFYCPMKRGACGATIPLSVFIHSNERGIMAKPNTLCYIWPKGFKSTTHPSATLSKQAKQVKN